MDSKKLGIILIIISIVLAITFIYSTTEIRKLIEQNINLTVNEKGECIHEAAGGICPFEARAKLSIMSYIALILIISILVFGIYLLRKKEEKKEEKSGIKKIDMSKLDENEKKIYELIKQKDGSIYQSDLIKETGFSKVQITRILDKMEAKKIIGRERRGMTNIIVLK